MQSDRWKKASLAIDAMIRGLEQDQIVFNYDYDETACRAITSLVGRHASAANDDRAELTRTSSTLLLELSPLNAASAAA